MRRLLRAPLRTPLGVAAYAWLGLVVALAVFAPVLWSARAAAVDVNDLSAGPSAAHWLGTDDLGRDVFSRVLVAARPSVGLALAATAIAVAAGLLLGTAPAVLSTAPGVLGRAAGRLVVAVVNTAVAFPALLLALFLAVIFGTGAAGATLAIGFAMAPAFARLTQTLAASVSGRDFVAAARIAGVGRIRVITRHILPNIGGPLAVNAAIGAGGALLAFAGLSFLGLGVQPPSYDWGQMLQEGLRGIYEHPAGALGPGLAIVVAGLAFSLFGEALAKGFGQRAAVRRPAARHLAPAEPSPPGLALDVRDLRVCFGPAAAVRGVSFAVHPGEAVGLVGESGSGKSLTVLAAAALVPEASASRLSFLGTSLLPGARDPVRRRLLGTSLGVVFQDPATAFNPGMRIGAQLGEVATTHLGMSRRAGLTRAASRLRAVGLSPAERRVRQFPHQLSGGTRQRALIAMGLMGEPALIIADEPTTALDVVAQEQVLRLLAGIRAAQGVALLLVSHDITVVRQVCDRVLVMYAGEIVEELGAGDLARARHPYTRALLAAVPTLDASRDLPLAAIPGRPPAPDALPAGCAFAPRCPLADDTCRAVPPPLAGGVACWHPDASQEPGQEPAR